MTDDLPQTQQHSQAPAEDFTGRVLGNYRLIRRLGRGGMAEVYLAQQTTLDRPVAIKILKPELARDQTYVARFHREAKAAATLTQTNIVQIYEVGHFDGLHFIAQEYVRGQNLREYLNRNQIVEPILAVSIMRQVAAALIKASEHNVIHRDIKPENILISPGGEVKVADFGLARVMDDKRSDLTQIGITMGTPLYMSPEQAEGSRVDTRSDLYSLGITTYHMLTGRPPFDAGNALAIAVRHVKEEAPSLHLVRPDLPKQLCDIVHRLMHKKPADRYQNPEELVKDLRDLEIDDVMDWEKLSEKLAVNEHVGSAFEPTPTSRLAVTRQLETIMTGHFRPWWKSTWLRVGTAFTLLAGLGIGALLATWYPPLDPLNINIVANLQVPRKSTAAEQYFYASLPVNVPPLEREENLLAVQAYFPQYDKETGQENKQNLLWIRLADERLGELYLESGQLDEALAIFERLANLEETEERFRLIGKAGQAIAYDRLKEVQESQRDLELLEQNIDELQNPYFVEQIRILIDRKSAAKF